MAYGLKETLAGLGTALYVHRGLIKRAERARDAVDYLAAAGLFRTKTADDNSFAAPSPSYTPSGVLLGAGAGALGGAAIGGGMDRYVINANRDLLRSSRQQIHQLNNEYQQAILKNTPERMAGIGEKLNKARAEHASALNKLKVNGRFNLRGGRYLLPSLAIGGTLGGMLLGRS